LTPLPDDACSDVGPCRQETAASVSHLAQLLLQSWKKSSPKEAVNILDLCTGTGCIPLLIHHELYKQPGIEPIVGEIVGVDISSQALRLADENKAVQLREYENDRHSNSRKLAVLRKMQFVQADILADQTSSSSVLSKLGSIGQAEPNYEILISNPPYISSAAFRTTTAASVRRYEPKLALVPPHPSGEQTIQDGDAFYPELYKIARLVNSKVVLFEVADMEQACRVAGMANEHWHTVEIWRDDPGVTGCEVERVDLGSKIQRSVEVGGNGNGRSVVAYTAEGRKWAGQAQ
jgi:methylase of polypeptide subunit release factors